MHLRRWLLAALLPLAACEISTDPGPRLDPDAPARLTYQLIPSGDPGAPLGVLLSWDLPTSGRANAFNIYGRSGSVGNWTLRATTTSTTFHDAGTPEEQYYVATRDANGNEIGNSNVVTIDLTSSLPAPNGLGSVSLNGAIQLYWSSNAANVAGFDHYRVYSTDYVVSRSVCSANWVLEGSTVSDGFLVGNLTNGVSRCYAVSAVTTDGHESEWSASVLDTPRWDARNAFVYSRQARPDSAGFLFLDEVSKKIGSVASTTRADLDFTIERHDDGSLWFAPARSGVTMMLYAATPVGDLTSIDFAPASGFAAATIEAVPGYAYVFRVQKNDGVHYAAARVAFVTPTYVVFDWSYQSAVGNAELNVIPAR
jgi:fibronectin type 3 domain-containing protein